MPSNLTQVPEQSGIDERRAALYAAQSLLTIKRFGWKVGFFVAFAALQATVGHGFFKNFASLALASTMFGIVIGQWRRERVAAPYYTHFDEAVWFMLLAGIVDRFAS